MGRTFATSKTATAAAMRTPSPSKKKRPQPPRNKIESSPNNRAKCRKCGIKITKGEERYGFVERSEYGATQVYYHPKCCPADLKSKLPSPEKMKDIKTVEDRRELADQLHELRRLFAEELGVEEHYKIWKNRTQDELVVNLPTTHAELLQIWGIAEKKAQNFGDPILMVIRQYKNQQANNNNAFNSSTNNGPLSSGSKRKGRLKKKSDESDVDGDIAVGETLTCEEIVKRKFEHAKENGYVISID